MAFLVIGTPQPLLRAQRAPVVDPTARQGGTLQGTLLSTEDNRPVEGLIVRAVEADLTVQTDGSGRYILADLRPGGYTLQVFQGDDLRLQLTDVVVRPGETLVVPPQRLPVWRRDGEVPTLAELTIHAPRLRGLAQTRESWTRDTITGSHLQRIGAASLSQRHLDREALAQRSAITPAMLLATVPEVNGLPLNVSAVAGTSARGDNTAISLRGLGSGNTLLLLNGRRMVAHPIAPLDEQSVPTLTVNVNQLPMHGFYQIDVLKGGASSTHGFDAVAGVVNYRMETDFRGQEIGVQVAIPEAGENEETSVHWMGGGAFAEGRGRYFSVVDFFHREPLLMADREFSAEAVKTDRAPVPFDQAGGAFDDASSVGRFPRFRVGSSSTDYYFRPENGAGSVPVLTTERPSQSADPEYYYNVNESQSAFPEADRINLYNLLEFDLTPDLTAFGEFSGYVADSFVQRRPIPYNGASGVDQPVVLSVDNPYNPYGAQFWAVDGSAAPDGSPRLVGSPQELTLRSVSLVDAGPEQIDIRSEVWRGLLGLRGRWAGSWSWESALLHSAASTRDISRNEVRESLLQAAARRSDALAFNPFGYIFLVNGDAVVTDQPQPNSAEAVALYVDEFERIGRTSLTMADFRATGDVLLPGDRVLQLAFGIEYRAERFSDWRAPYAGLNPADSGLDPEDNDFVQASPTANIRAHRNVAAVYVESAVPIFGEAAAGSSDPYLELTFAGRYERYDDFGDELAPRFGLNWLISPRLQVHASLDRSFRAPNLAVLHALPRRRVLTGVSDNYRRTVTGEGTYSANIYYPGSPDLQPEEAVGFNTGFAAEVPGVENLTLKLDYWLTEQSSVVGSDSGFEIMASDYRLLTSYIAEQVAAGVPAASINLGSGTAFYRGDPRVQRLRPTAADQALFADYNANQPADEQRPVIGAVDYLARPFQNNRSGYASGVDFGLEWSSGRTSSGVWDFDLNASYLLRSYTINESTGQRQARRDTEIGQRLRGISSLSWRGGGWGVSLTAYYTSRFADTTATTSAATYAQLGEPDYIMRLADRGEQLFAYRVASTLSADLALSYQFDDRARWSWLRRCTARLKVANVTDEEPPLQSNAAGFSMEAHARLVAGRTWGLELIKSF